MKKFISIITPTFNEETNIEKISNAIAIQMQNLNYDYEHIIIDNASTDNTQSIIRGLCLKSKKVRAILNSKNFGHIRSPYHALLCTKGDAVIIISSDFQDPPELIPQLIQKWENGSEVVFLKRTSSKTNFILEQLKLFFYKVLNLISDVKLEKNTTGAGIFDKKIIENLKKINDPYPYFRGMIFEFVDKVDIIEFEQPQRLSGKSNSSFFVLFDIAMLGIVKHSKFPLRIMTISGFTISIGSLFVGIFFIIKKLLFWDEFQLGLAPLIAGVFFGISIIIFMLGLIGEYVGFVLTQTRNLPLVVEKERINFD
jgi:glycosyltransferase involved in cell wall biosynthesis